MKKQRKEITEEKLRYATNKLLNYIKNPMAMRDVEILSHWDNYKAVYKTNNQKTYIGYRCLDKTDTRLSIKKYNKEKYVLNEYKAITPRYIQQFVCKEKVSLRLINYILVNFIINKKLVIMQCSDIRQIVVHNNDNWGGTTGLNIFKDSAYERRFKSLVHDYHFVKNYLKSNKIENSNSRLAISV